jgi:hypothetical protein
LRSAGSYPKEEVEAYLERTGEVALLKEVHRKG